MSSGIQRRGRGGLGRTLRGADVSLLVAYAAAFAALHHVARLWGGSGYFSLWYPAAGLRFAVLWRRGVRMTPGLMMAEVLTDMATGLVPWHGPEALHDIAGACRSSLVSGAVLGALQALGARHPESALSSPMRFGLAAILAPTLNALMVVPFDWLFPRPLVPSQSVPALMISLSSFVTGDVLGILMVAPALLWLTDLADAPRPMRLPPARDVAEAAGVLALGAAVTSGLAHAGLGVQAAPHLLAGAWVGLRFGRVGAWFAILVQALMLLPWSAMSLDYPHRLELHLGIASVVVVTWIAGTFTDAQTAARADLDRRNRMLFQAERLKTLRAMSVAVIHEISQPLATLAIEASHLNASCAGLDPDLAESAKLVDRKARHLSEMVRRLRRFGGRDVDKPSPLPLETVVRTARQIVGPELLRSGSRIEMAPIPADCIVQAQEIELTQALVNLLRNAITASTRADPPATAIGLTVQSDALSAAIEVSNAPISHAAAHDVSNGMGIGLAIARTIIEAHGGALTRHDGPDRVRFVVELPLVPMAIA